MIFAPPVRGGRIISRQGCRHLPRYTETRPDDLVLCDQSDGLVWRWHNGDDVVGPDGPREGAPVEIPLPGRMRWAAQPDGVYRPERIGDRGSGGYGMTAIVEHLPNVLTLYGHLSWVLEAVGEYLPAGTVVGRIGSTSGSRDEPEARVGLPHLHHEWVSRWPLRSDEVTARYDVLASLAAIGIVEQDHRLVYWEAGMVLSTPAMPGRPPGTPGIPEAAAAADSGAPLALLALLAASKWRRRRMEP